MYNLATTPEEKHDHFYNYFKGKTNDGTSLHIDTQALGIRFHHDRHSQQLNPPHQRKLSNVSPLDTSRAPPLSPACSPISSSPTSPGLQQDSGVNIPHRVRRNKSIITRKTSAQSSTSPVSSQSYEHIKSPAASFLASFAAPTSPPPSDSHRPSLSTYFEEQTGDEIDDYVMNQIIGYGGFSTVRKGYCISNGQTVAIKIIKKKTQDPLSTDEALERELDIWQTLDHDNIVRIQKVLETDYATYVVCDYCANGSLLDRLLAQPPLSDQEKKRLFSQLCDVVHYLHKQANVIHRDIKLDNILLDDDMNIKLCDFGLAVYQTVTLTHLETVAHPNSPLSSGDNDDNNSAPVGGSLAYCAPEQIKSTRVLTCPKTDVWSLGVVLFAMFAGRLPFDDDYDVRLRQSILSGQYTIPDRFSSGLADLVSHCLDLDPTTRFSLDQIMNHSWLKE
ncbi:kinase-like domain-containing protein [Chlamydoabsidia padenii]|nr:kinase-like domain-containing protein [Chlamydoabsidia padenii]